MSENINKELLLECMKIAAKNRDFVSCHSADEIFATALVLYDFIENQRIGMHLNIKDEHGHPLWIEIHTMTHTDILQDYKRLKAKELSEEAEKAKNSTNNGNPLESGVKARMSFYSRLFGYFGFKESTF